MGQHVLYVKYIMYVWLCAYMCNVYTLLVATFIYLVLVHYFTVTRDGLWMQCSCLSNEMNTFLSQIKARTLKGKDLKKESFAYLNAL